MGIWEEGPYALVAKQMRTLTIATRRAFASDKEYFIERLTPMSSVCWHFRFDCRACRMATRLVTRPSKIEQVGRSRAHDGVEVRVQARAEARVKGNCRAQPNFRTHGKAEKRVGRSDRTQKGTMCVRMARTRATSQTSYRTHTPQRLVYDFLEQQVSYTIATTICVRSSNEWTDLVFLLASNLGSRFHVLLQMVDNPGFSIRVSR